MKNIDKIRAMSVEELANNIAGLSCEMCFYQRNGHDCRNNRCESGIAKWLEQEQNPLPSFKIADVIETVNNRYVVIWENIVIGVKERHSTTIPAYICPIDDVVTHETVITIWRYTPKKKLFEKIWRADDDLYGIRRADNGRS